MPGFLPIMNLAALSAPVAKISFERAECFISIISSFPANITECSPTIVPPRMACMPISFLLLFFLR